MVAVTLLGGCGFDKSQLVSKSEKEEPAEPWLVEEGNNPEPAKTEQKTEAVKPKPQPTPDPMPEPEPEPKTPTLSDVDILNEWSNCGSGNALRQHVKDGHVNATTAYLHQFTAILADPYCDDDRVTKFLSYRHFRQFEDRVNRVRELTKQYADLNVDSTVLYLANETVKHVEFIRDSFNYYKLSQSVLFWKGFTDFVSSEKPVGEILAEGAGKAFGNRIQLEIDLRKQAKELREKWTEAYERLAEQDVRLPELLWAPLPAPESKHDWVPFPPHPNRKFTLGAEAVPPERATPIEFGSDGTAQFGGQLTCKNKQHIYKLTNDDFRMMSIILKKDVPILFSTYSVELFSDFDPERIYHAAMPNQDGIVSFLLEPGTYYLRLLSWRDVIDADDPLDYHVTMYRGQSLREHMTSGRAFVGYEESNSSVKPFRIEFNFAEGDRITGRISWPTLLSETFLEGEYIETPRGTRLQFTETKVAKRSPFVAHKVFTGGVYRLEPKVYDRRFVLEGEWKFGRKGGRIRCLAAGLHNVSLNDKDRKETIAKLSKDHKHTGRVEQGGQFLDAEFTVVYDEERGSTSGFVYWPRHPLKHRMKQYTDGVVIDTPRILLLRLVDTRFVASSIRKFPSDTTTYFLQPKSGASGSGFLGRWRQGGRTNGEVDVTIE